VAAHCPSSHTTHLLLLLLLQTMMAMIRFNLVLLVPVLLQGVYSSPAWLRRVRRTGNTACLQLTATVVHADYGYANSTVEHSAWLLCTLEGRLPLSYSLNVDNKRHLDLAHI